MSVLDIRIEPNKEYYKNLRHGAEWKSGRILAIVPIPSGIEGKDHWSHHYAVCDTDAGVLELAGFQYIKEQVNEAE
jgi:hypothetical protein